MARTAAAIPMVRICLDLNVWVADFIGMRRGRRGGSTPWLADAARAFTCAAGSVQLVISIGMLDRLARVYTRVFGLDTGTAAALTEAIGTIASMGPAGDDPYALVGGGVFPIRDTEDRHVLEVAIAGDADILATANLADFDMNGIDRIGNGSRVRIYAAPGRRPLIIAHPDQVRDLAA